MKNLVAAVMPPIAAVLVMLAPPGQANAQMPPAEDQATARCDGDAAAKMIGLDNHDWQVACLQVAGRRQVIAAVPMLPIPTVMPARPGVPARSELKPDPKNLAVRVALAK